MQEQSFSDEKMLVANFCHGASSLTQLFVLASSIDHDEKLTENS